MDIKSENPPDIHNEGIRHTPLPDHLIITVPPQTADVRWRNTTFAELHKLTLEEWSTLNDLLGRQNSYR
mgnify:FL=1